MVIVRDVRKKDVKEHERKVHKARYRVLVEGMRGKSGVVEKLCSVFQENNISFLGKVTGLTPHVIYGGEKIRIIRKDHKRFFLEKENISVTTAFPDVDAYVIENQGTMKDTIYHIRDIWRPKDILIPNIRYEHMEGMGDTLEEIAKTYAGHLKDVERLYFADPNKNHRKLGKLLKQGCTDFGVKFIYVKVPKELSEIPMIEQYFIIDAFCKEHELKPKIDLDEFIKKINKEIEPEHRKKYLLFDGAKVNDPESTELVLKYLQKKYPGRKIVVVAYFRMDRVDRTYSFLEFFEKIGKDKKICAIILSGFGCKAVAERVQEREKVSVVKHPKEAIKIIKKYENQEIIVFLAVNRVNKFMNELKNLF